MCNTKCDVRNRRDGNPFLVHQKHMNVNNFNFLLTIVN